MGIFIPNMGMKPKRRGRKVSAPRNGRMIDALFTGTQQRVLGLIFGQPARSFYATELINLAGAGSGAVQRELIRLVRSGLVTVRPVGNQMHYQANPASPLFHELRAITQKTVGLADPIRDALRTLASEIRAAFIYGSIAKEQDTATSDIDVMLISDSLTYGDAYSVLETVSGQLGRPVNPTILSGKDLARRVKEDDAFASRVLSQPKIWLIGGEDDLRV
jgi:predicted nucleotidyltransferase